MKFVVAIYTCTVLSVYASNLKIVLAINLHR